MYKFNSAQVIEKKLNPSIISLDISTYKMIDVYSMFLRVYIKAYNVLTAQEELIDIESIRDTYQTSTLTLSKVLERTDHLPQLDHIPTKVSSVEYADIYLSGYKVKPCIIGEDTPVGTPLNLLKDLVITKNYFNTDLSLLHTHSLLTLNGYIQPTDANVYKNEAYIVGGYDNTYYSHSNHIGLLSFLNLGSIDKYPIKDENIIYSKDTDLVERLYIHLPTSIENKTVMLSLGGHLILPDQDTLYATNTNVVCLKPHKLNLIEKYLESRKYVDLSSLNMDISTNNPDMINIKQLYSNDTIKAWLQLPQSFIIVLDAKEVIYNRIYLRHGKLPGRYISYHRPTLPLILGHGRMAEYWVTEEDGVYELNTLATGYNNYTHQYTTNKYKLNIDDSRISCDTYNMEKPYLLQILSLS